MTAPVQGSNNVQALSPRATQNAQKAPKQTKDSISCCNSTWNGAVKTTHSCISSIASIVWRAISHLFCKGNKPKTPIRHVTPVVVKPPLPTPKEKVQERILQGMKTSACNATPIKKPNMSTKDFLKSCEETLTHRDTHSLRRLKTFMLLLNLEATNPRDRLSINVARLSAFRKTPLLRDEIPKKMGKSKEEVETLIRSGKLLGVINSTKQLIEEFTQSPSYDLKTYIQLIEDEALEFSHFPTFKLLLIQFALQNLPDDAIYTEGSDMQRIIQGLPSALHDQFALVTDDKTPINALGSYFESHPQNPKKVLLTAICELIKSFQAV